MNLRILDVAEADLWRGFRFYQRKSRGVGWYFLDTLSAEIESLHLYAGIHRNFLVIIGCCRVAFRMQFTTVLWMKKCKFGVSWTAVAIPIGFGNNWARSLDGP
jgi:hypothetical protein